MAARPPLPCLPLERSVVTSKSESALAAGKIPTAPASSSASESAILAALVIFQAFFSARETALHRSATAVQLRRLLPVATPRWRWRNNVMPVL